jgi:hypothetical protein
MVSLLLLSACTSAPAPTTTTTAPSPSTTLALSPEEATGQFEDCLTDQGIEVREIPRDEAGRPDLAALAGSLGEGLPDLRRALTVCASVLVTSGALDLANEAVLGEAVRSQLAGFSKCMRSNGVESFPDPDPEFDGTSPPYADDSVPVSDPDLESAIETCTQVLGNPS